MLKRNVLLAAAALFMISPLAQTESRAQGLPTFFAVLNGANECDSTAPPAGPVCRKGERRAFGSATITLISGTSLCVGIVVDNLATAATAVHIHTGGATVNGPILISISPPLPFPNPPGGGNPGATSGCITVGIPAAAITAIRNNPQNHYLNIHNTGFPGGAVRGQLF